MVSPRSSIGLMHALPNNASRSCYLSCEVLLNDDQLLHARNGTRDHMNQGLPYIALLFLKGKA